MTGNQLETTILIQLEHYLLLLADTDHYQLLGVEPEASKAEIKQAYFKLAKVFHTDRYSREDLGDKHDQMQRVFSALTKAHDVISRKRTRKAYDDYLRSCLSTRHLRFANDEPEESTTSDTIPSKGSAEASAYVVGLIPREPRVPLVEEVIKHGHDVRADSWRSDANSEDESKESLKQEDGGESESSPAAPGSEEPLEQEDGCEPESSPAAPGSEAHSVMPITPRDKNALRKNLARKLKSNQVDSGGTIDSEKALQIELRQAAVAGFRQRYQQESKSTDRIALRLEQQAEEAERTQDISTLVSRLRALRELKPEDQTLLLRLEEAELNADVAFSHQFLEQARYEEKHGEFARAAKSYLRSARGSQNAASFERAAQCFLKAGKSAREAVTNAKEAIRLNNQQPLYHMTLARAYTEAGMSSSARAAAERALELNPKNELATSFLKELK